jgi:hypothetical protein
LPTKSFGILIALPRPISGKNSFDSMTKRRPLSFASACIAPRVYHIIPPIADVKEEAIVIVWEELQSPTRASPSKFVVQTCSIVTERE